MFRHLISTLVVAALALLPSAAHAQPRGGGPDQRIDAAIRKRVLDAAVKALTDQYIFPDVAAKMVELVRTRQREGAYDKLTSARAFALALTEDLQHVSRDKHLNVAYVASKLPVDRGKPRSSAPTADDQRRAALVNYGFDRVERLEGNVGYLKLRAFMPAQLAGDIASAAMTFLASTDALIIDLRENGGGSPEMVALVSSYLFGDEPVHLNDLYYRPDDATTQYWTHAYVPGRRFGPNKPVYVLTSQRTFSAAEEFSYNLKTLKRATIVGETSGGGAHPGGGVRLDDHFGMFVPTGRAINPVTKTNWEGVGVKPDVAVSAADAYQRAYVLALERLLAAEADARIKPLRQQALTEARAKK